MTSLPFLSARAWPGLRPWLASVLGTVAVFEFLAALAWRSERGGWPDVTTALVVIPIAFILGLMVSAASWTLLTGVSFEGGLAFAARILPVAWIFPFFDLLRTFGRGLVVSVPVADGNGLLLSLATGGLMPLDSGITAGMRLGMFAGAVFAGLLVWHLTQKAWKTLVAALVASAVFTKLVYFASGLGLWQRLTSGSGWTAGESEVSRSILLVVTNGYWWSNVYDRFPTAVDAQAAIALRLTTAGLFVLGLGAALTLVFAWRISAWKRSARHVYRSWTAFDLALYAVGGVLITALGAQIPGALRLDAYAVSVFLFMLMALRLASALRCCLRRLPEDERAGSDQPIARGDLNPETARDVIAVAVLYALTAAWTLGWPVFAAVLVHLAASHLTRDRSWSEWPWLATAFRSVGAASLALSGAFFAAQNARLTLAAVLACCLAAAHRLVVEFVWIPWKTSRA